jgi:enoyl-CoA hydratase/carnithine racemase
LRLLMPFTSTKSMGFRLVGARPAERLAVTGLLVSPSDAAILGLVDEVVLAEQVVEGDKVVPGSARTSSGCDEPDS